MKKILLCTTALFGLVAGTALAEDVAVTFNGSSIFEAGARKVDRDHKAPFDYSPNQKSTAFYTMHQASLKAEGKANSLTYGAILRLQLVANSDDGAGDYTNNRSYIYLDTDIGAIQLGSNAAASRMLKIDAGTIASATGGVDGDWSNFTNVNAINPSLTLNEKAVSNVRWNGLSTTATAQDSLMMDSIADSLAIQGVDTLSNRLDKGESARKITYLSPRISGLQMAISFVLDLGNGGSNNLLTRDNINDDGTVSVVDNMYMGSPVRVKNLWSLGLNYTNVFNDITVGLSVGADKGKASKQTISYMDENVNSQSATLAYRDLKTYSIGASVAAKGFTLATSYQNDGKSLTLTSQDRFKASWWTVGLGYAQDKMSASVSYLSGKKGSNNQNVTTKLTSLGVDYEVVPGMIQMKPKSLDSSDSKSKSTVFILGTKLKF